MAAGMEKKSEVDLNYVVACPAPGIGHLNAMISLSTRLVSLGVAVKFVSPGQSAFRYVSGTPEAAHFEVICLLKNAPAAQKRVFQVKPGFIHLQFADFELPDYSAEESGFESLLQGMVDSGHPPAALIFDTGIIWACPPASKLSIPTFAFSANSGIDALFDVYISKLLNEGSIPVPDPEDFNGELRDLVDWIPGCPPLRRYDVKLRILMWSTSKFSEIKRKTEDQILSSNGLLLNSCGELDERVVAAISSGEVSEQLKGKVFPVGPLIRKSFISKQQPGYNDIDEKQAWLIRWLEDQPPNSVLYISFGSWETICEEQAVELAAGLEASNVRFLWVESLEGQVPADLKDRRSDRGLVHFGFVPQQFILEHGSVGAFLTHCGWNSVVESVSLGGIPVIAMPLMLDQPLNAALLVENGVGVEPEVNTKGIVEKSEVERAIRLVMDGETGQKFRDRAAELKRKVCSACSTSSVTQLELLVSKFRNH